MQGESRSKSWFWAALALTLIASLAFPAIYAGTREQVLIDVFNYLLDHRQITASGVVARLTIWLYPESNAAKTMMWKARFLSRLERADVGTPTNAKMGGPEYSCYSFDENQPMQFPDIEWDQRGGATSQAANTSAPNAQ